MTRIQYINGITHILWGLVLIIPLSKNFNLRDALVLAPLISLFLLTGIGIINNKRFAWTFALVLGFLILIHFIISIFHEAYRDTDVRLGTESIILFSIWSTLMLLTLYATIRILRNDVRSQLGVQRGQLIVTFTICIVLGIIWSLFLLNEFQWL